MYWCGGAGSILPSRRNRGKVISASAVLAYVPARHAVLRRFAASKSFIVVSPVTYTETPDFNMAAWRSISGTMLLQRASTLAKIVLVTSLVEV